MNRITTKEKIIRVLLAHQDTLTRYKVKSIALFGSYVRERQKKKSDIDFLVEFEEPSFDNYIGLLNDLKLIFKQPVDLVSIKALKERIKPYILAEAEWIKR